MTWIAENKRKFELVIRKHVTESFNYADGSKLVGAKAGASESEWARRFSSAPELKPVVHMTSLIRDLT